MSDRLYPIQANASLISPNGTAYRIVGKRLRRAGLGFLYQGETQAGRPVLIKEYFPVDLAQRKRELGRPAEYEVEPAEGEYQLSFESSRNEFRDAANALRSVTNPSVLPVAEVFDLNGTTYSVWGYPDEAGSDWVFETLDDWMRKRMRKVAERKEHFPEIFERLLDAAETMAEQGFAHLNVKPSNVFMFGEQPFIADFGIRGWYTEPFAAPEQYDEGRFGAAGCSADLYGIGATMVSFLLGGKEKGDLQSGDEDPILITAPKRLKRVGGGLPDPVERWVHREVEKASLSEEDGELLLQCLALDPAERGRTSGESRRFDDPGFHFPALSFGPGADVLVRWIANEPFIYAFEERQGQKKFRWSWLIDDAGIACCGKVSADELLVVPARGEAKLWRISAAKPELIRTVGSQPMQKPEMVVVAGGGTSFEISQCTITVAQYLSALSPQQRALRIASAFDPGMKTGGDCLPVTNITWDDAVHYAALLSEETGLQYRLPTEQEWAQAAKEQDNSIFPWGDSVESAPAHAHFCSTDGPIRVDEFDPNRNGLFQVVGNVWEWTASQWSDPAGEATSGSIGRLTLCGGGWMSEVQDIRLDSRIWGEKNTRYPTVGFRVVRDLP